MPELPEVETISRRLNDLIPGRKIAKLQILHEKSFQGDRKTIEGMTIQEVNRRAKILRFKLNEALNLLVHLKMTGQLIFLNDKQRVGGGHPTADWVSDLPSKHTRVIVAFADDATLFFNDMRIFGWIRLMTDQEVEAEFAKYGPDVNDQTLTFEYFKEKLSRRSVPIKQVLMDNKVLAGVGNIYAVDALNLAKISPLRPAKSLTDDEILKLLKSSRQVIERGIELGGTTYDGKYVNVEGFAGGYQNELRVYDRQGEACPNCGAEIEKVKIAGRGTYFCPSCQR
ncbi:MAG: bifunctional DNA-formamidopyrimidine glycosylase/DNA-(apurinic or apyrimidinic site) lyase [Candidatus Woesebacteria bacterium]|jgi:formamidopyrimidine-DNA glycosylase